MTTKNFAEKLGVDYATARAFVQYFLKTGAIVADGFAPHPEGARGKRAAIYHVVNSELADSLAKLSTMLVEST